MKRERLEKEVTATIKAMGDQRKAKLDTANPLLRSAIRDMIVTKHSEARAKLKEKAQEEVLMEGNVSAPERLPGCRQLFDYILMTPVPTSGPKVIEGARISEFLSQERHR
jgi:hypothetical protein